MKKAKSLYPVKMKSIPASLEYYPEVIKLYNEAEKYISGFHWCATVINADLYLNLGRVLCIFLFEIDNTASDEDNLLWIVTGDIPPAYLDIYGPKNTTDVLLNYVALAKDWIDAVRAGESVEDCYPFDAVPTNEMADMLASRIDFIKNNLVSNINSVRIKI